MDIKEETYEEKTISIANSTLFCDFVDKIFNQDGATAIEITRILPGRDEHTVTLRIFYPKPNLETMESGLK